MTAPPPMPAAKVRQAEAEEARAHGETGEADAELESLAEETPVSDVAAPAEVAPEPAAEVEPQPETSEQKPQ